MKRSFILFAVVVFSSLLLFGYKVADEVRRRFHLKLWNVYNFFVTYANLDKWTPGIYRKPGRTSNVLDEWILTRLNQMVNVVTDSLEKFDAAGASLEIEKFVDDLSLWYIRRSRDRVGPAKESDKDAKAFYSTTYYVLYTLGKILAPFMPYFSEAVYTNLTHELSVHLADWPKEMPAISDDEKKLIVEMEKVREIVEKVHAKRKELGIPVRQPLAKLVVKNYKLQNLKIEKVFLDEINVKEVSFVEGKEGLSIDLDEKITPELKEESDVRDLIRKIQEERKRLNLNLTQKVDVVIEKIPASNKLVQWMLKKAQISHLKEGVFMVKKAS